MIGQTAQIAPADKKLYALRDVTGTVESIPLISASIMSKKIAEGIDALVLDVKTGSGAFMKTEADSRRLAESLVSIGNASGVQTEAIITAMDAPLGRAVGNALEVIECLEVLKGGGPPDLVDVSVELAARMLVLGKVADDRADAETQVRERDRVRRRARALPPDHRDPGRRSARRRRLQPPAARRPIATSSRRDRAGYLTALDAELVGRASVALGAGRDRVEDPVDPAVGIMVARQAGRRRCAPAIRCSSCTTAIARGSTRRSRWRAAPSPSATRRRPPGALDRRRGPLMLGVLQPLFGAFVILAIAVAFSNNRRAINWTTVAWGLGLQIVFALIVLKTTIGQRVFETLGDGINKLLGFAGVGAAFVFGPLGDSERLGPRDDRRARAGRRALRASSSRSRCCRPSSSSRRCSPSSTTSASCSSSCGCSRS